MIENFHFLRPWWLLALLIPAVITWLSAHSTDIRSRWKTMIAPHLLDRLVVDGKGGPHIRPSWMLAGILTAAVIAVAGPTWEREASPFVEDTAPLVIAVDLSPTMDAIDVTPSRLERVKLQIRDVVGTRGGARTAVVAYSGSAHLVLPLTEDASLIETYTDALATRIMPVGGKDTAKALDLAKATLSKERATGTILLITDGVEPKAFDAFKRNSGGNVIVLAVGTVEGGPVKKPDGGFLTDQANSRVFAKLDVDGLKKLHAETGTEVATMTDDDTDIRWVAQRIRSQFARKQAEEGNRWRDMGWWIVVPLVVLFGLSFRKGWVVRMGAALLAARLLLPTGADAADFNDMWLTPDQQGRLSFEHGNYAGAADHFSDPMWRGVALYKAGKFAEAVDAFAAVDTAESWYDQGNALLHLSMPEQSVAAYRKALQLRKDWPDATANLAIAERLLKAKEDEEEEQQEPSEKPDKVQFDDKGKQGKEGKMSIAEQTSEMWMKNIQVSPTDLMARKFAIEASKEKP